MPEIERLKTAIADRYTIGRELGAGGMATVYVAEDLKHDRKVALKVLKPELAAVLGGERFVQEIKTTASLQHPHILPLFDSGEADGFLYYVMPFVEGETLRDKLNREKQLGIEEAVQITTDVADALDYAHRHDVIHRDIKPENILLHDGRPMVSDFGIALAVSAAAGGRMTETGLSLGTPHYMSPEQATAEKDLTSRSDVYSLGAVLYEMLAGDPPHTGSTAQQIIMKIVAEDAESVTNVRRSVPPNVAAAVDKALEKLPADRFRSASELRTALAEPSFTHADRRGPRTAPSGGPVSSGVTRFVWPAVAAALAIAAVWGWQRPTDGSSIPPSVSVIADALPTWGVGLGISRDGRTVVYNGLSDGVPMLFRRPVDDLEATPIQGTEWGHDPVFSPNGEWIVFKVFRPGRGLRRVRVTGGSPATLVDSNVAPNGGLTWGPDDMIYYPRVAEDEIAISRVPSAGGDPEVVTTADSGTEHWAPGFLPGGRTALFTIASVQGRYDIASLTVETGEWERIGGEMQGIVPRYVAPGRLIYLRPDGSLMAARFDVDRLEGVDRPIPIGRVDLRDGNQASPQFAVSAVGSLLYFPPVPTRLVAMDRAGTRRVLVSDLRQLRDFAYSPRGTRLLVGTMESFWIFDRRDASRTRVQGATEMGWGQPKWATDGERVFYEGILTLSRAPTDGSEPPQLFFTADHLIGLMNYPAPGLPLLVGRMPMTTSLTALDPETGEVSAENIPLQGRVRNHVSLSPDGRWLAYTGVVGETPTLWIQSFPEPSQRIRVEIPSPEDATIINIAPHRWMPDGSGLFYSVWTVETGQVWTTRVSTGPLRAHSAQLAFDSIPAGFVVRLRGPSIAVHPNGNEVAWIEREGLHSVVLVQGWEEIIGGGR